MEKFLRCWRNRPIGSLNDAMVPTSGQRILVFSPHPDDETIGVGGYIAQSRKDGADVRIVLVTDGNRHNQKDLRYSEFKKATSILGVPESDLLFLNFPDSKLRGQGERALYEAFKARIDSYSPDIVLSTQAHGMLIPTTRQQAEL